MKSPPFLYPQQCVPLSPMELDDYIQVHRRAIERVLGHHIWSLTFRFRSLFETARRITTNLSTKLKVNDIELYIAYICSLPCC